MISATLLIGMMASVMVFSSFVTPKENAEVLSSQVSAQDDWKEVGRYYGYDANGKRSMQQFIVWEKQGMCGAYYWTYMCQGWVYNPDQINGDRSKASGQLRQNSEKKWYASYDGTQYFINF